MQTEPSVGPVDDASAGNPAAGVPAAGVPVAGNPVAGNPAAGAPVAGTPVADAATGRDPDDIGSHGSQQPRDPRPHRATARFMLSHPLHMLSLGFGSGLSPIAPGTVGTLFAWASFAVFSNRLTVIEWAVLIVGGFFGGIAVCSFTANRLGIDDPSQVVWDEIVAFWLVLLMVTPATLTGQLWAFIVFRFFDMVKPPPIRYFDRRLKGGFGIMFDDLVAAFFTLLVIALWRMSV